MLPCILKLSLAAGLNFLFTNAAPESPVWPEKFHALILINRTNKLALADLWYDWPAGRNLLQAGMYMLPVRALQESGHRVYQCSRCWMQIRNQLASDTLHDLELNNGTQYFWSDEKPEACKTIQQPVGILFPDWLHGAQYLGQEWRDSHLCDVWTKAPWTPSQNFIYYYADTKTGRPVFWKFFDGAEQHVLRFDEEELPDGDWGPAQQCLEKSPSSQRAAPEQLNAAVASSQA